MAGNRRHAGGMNSAMANLKTSDGELAARRAREAAEHPVTPLTKREAIERYAKFRDSALGFVPSIERAKRLAEVASPEELKAFSKATGHLSWPESFGQTPWETAGALGYGLQFEESTGHHHWAHEMLEAYRTGRRALEGERAVPESQTRSMALYIYPSEAGEMGGQILEQGKAVWGVAGCLDRNEVIEAATEAGYQDLRITDVPHVEDVLQIERLHEEIEDEQDLGR
ncbi:MAG: hypothetical protein ACYCT1_02095 [Steroidobacteraceae bacterium]